MIYFEEESKKYSIPEVENIAFSIEEYMNDALSKVTFSLYGKNNCPRCHAVELHTYGIMEERKYRACKACGFWQELGGVPYQCNFRGHLCKESGKMSVQFFLPWEDPKRCAVCGQEFIKLLTHYEQLCQSTKEK